MTADAPGSPARPEDDLGYGSAAWKLIQRWASMGTVPTVELGAVLRRYAEVLDGPDPDLAAVRAENSRLVVQLAAVTRNCQEHHGAEETR